MHLKSSIKNDDFLYKKYINVICLLSLLFHKEKDHFFHVFFYLVRCSSFTQDSSISQVNHAVVTRNYFDGLFTFQSSSKTWFIIANSMACRGRQCAKGKEVDGISTSSKYNFHNLLKMLPSRWSPAAAKLDFVA